MVFVDHSNPVCQNDSPIDSTDDDEEEIFFSCLSDREANEVKHESAG